jgi:hypothetical protein
MNTVTPSLAYRSHMIAVDVCNAVYTSTDAIPALAMARARLGCLIRLCELRLGGRNEKGGWHFKNQKAHDAYAKTLGQVMDVVERQGAKTQDGLRWIVTAHGLAEDAELVARRGGRSQLAHTWRLIYRVLGWMVAQYEDQLDGSWVPGLALYDGIRRAANL